MAAPILITAGGGCCCPGGGPVGRPCAICGCTIITPYRLRLTRFLYDGSVYWPGSSGAEAFDLAPGAAGCAMLACDLSPAIPAIDGNNGTGGVAVTVNGHAGTLHVGGVVFVPDPPGCASAGITLHVEVTLDIPDWSFHFDLSPVIGTTELNTLAVGDCDVDSMMGTYVHVVPLSGMTLTFVFDRGAC